MAGIDRERIFRIFADIGQELREPAALCLIGSIPAVMAGQPERSTWDIDVWQPRSGFDTGDLMQACRSAGIAFDPKGEFPPGTAYLQIVQPGIVRLAADFPIETIGRFGKLTVTMPPPSLLCAAKLVRASDSDLEDVVWWVHHRFLTAQEVETAVRSLPDEGLRETAVENLVFVRLVAREGGKP